MAIKTDAIEAKTTKIVVTDPMTNKRTFEVDLLGGMISQPIVDKLKAQIAAAEDAGMVDITLRNVSRWGAYPDIIIDYSGEIREALAKALNIITEGR